MVNKKIHKNAQIKKFHQLENKKCDLKQFVRRKI